MQYTGYIMGRNTATLGTHSTAYPEKFPKSTDTL